MALPTDRTGAVATRPARPPHPRHPRHRLTWPAGSAAVPAASAATTPLPPAAPGPALRRAPRRSSALLAPLAGALVRLVTAVVLAGGVLLIGLLVADLGFHRTYQDLVLPGVRYGSLPLGGLTQEQAQGVLNVHARSLLESPVIFTYGEREWRPPAAEIGLSVDTEAMARDALQFGRGVPGLFRLPHALAVRSTRPTLPLQAKLDQAQLAKFLGAVALELDKNPVNAALAVRNGQLTVGQSTAGQRVDVAATMERVRPPQDLETPQRVEVVVVPLPPAMDDASIGEAQALAAGVLSGPLTLRAGSRTWTLTPEALGNMLDIRKVETPDAATGAREKLVASLNEAKIAAYVRTLAGQIDTTPLDAQLRWTGDGVAVIRASRDGARLDQAAAVRTILAQAATENREVALPVAVTKPAVSSDNLPQLGVRQLIATGTSRFAGSAPERINNIRVAAARLNGVIIPAGSTFSFLGALGPITKANGYQEGLTIQGDSTVPGIGGGVCQVSTTAFRAAFFAGLPIVERHQHTYRVSYYEQDGSPPGFDAAVYSPGVDLRFRNDTGAAILIQTSFDAGSSTLAFRFYGTPTGREVKLGASRANEVKAGPRLPDGTDPKLPKGTRKQVEWSADGVDATITRTISQNGETRSDSFFSRYSPWREKWVVGTGG